jgi:hypothetical protein
MRQAAQNIASGFSSSSTVPMLQATQTVSAAAASISASGERTAQATQENTAQNNASNAEIVARLASIELLLSKMPREMAEANTKIVFP